MIGGTYERLFHGRDDVSYDTKQDVNDVLRRALARAPDTRSLTTTTGAFGGFATPEYWAAGFYTYLLTQSFALSRSRNYPMPGQTLHICAWDSEDQSTGPIGGVSASWLSEGGTATAVTPKIREIELNAKKCVMYVNATREVLQDAPSL